MTERFQSLLDWLQQVPLLKEARFEHPTPASSDASFRRYYRIILEHPTTEAPYRSLIIMDAPPEHENCEPFIQVSQQMLGYGLLVPKVLEQDLRQGFLLLTDLGNETYLSSLNADTVEQLYRNALNALVTLQVRGHDASLELPEYSEALLRQEMGLFSEWLCGTHLQRTFDNRTTSIWQNVQSRLVDAALAQPKVYVHRDYHSRNLMVSDSDIHSPGILDFQDAVRGPLTYDAVSLLRDCYIRWPFEQVREWQRAYFLMLVEQRLLSRDEWTSFLEAMDLMGIQRHLKAAGIFARLYHRDGKEGYLGDLPRTLGYISEVGRCYQPFWSFADWVEDNVICALPDVDRSNAPKG